MSEPDHRHHLRSMLMRESLLDKSLMNSTERGSQVRRMLPKAHVVKVGGRSIIDRGREAVFPVVDVLGALLDGGNQLLLSTGGGARTRHVFSIGIDLGLPTGVLAQLSIADALGNAHILGSLLAPWGVVAIPPEMFGHLLPLFAHAVPGVIFNGDPPYSLWEHPPSIGRIPPHRTDAGTFLVAECFGCQSLTYVKDVDGIYETDPHDDPDAAPNADPIREISVSELRERGLAKLPFDRVLLDLLDRARLIDRFQIVNGLHPERIAAAVRGEHVGTIVHKG
ncbi:MAG: uridylate kinase [Myxococcota bacterium]